MARKVVHVVLNGVTGRMGYRQHLVRSLLAIREQGGVRLEDGTSLYPVQGGVGAVPGVRRRRPAVRLGPGRGGQGGAAGQPGPAVLGRRPTRWAWWWTPTTCGGTRGRGHLGDGVIDFGPVTAAVTAAGYDGFVEVEIFSAAVWDAPPDQTAATVRERFAAVFGGPG